MLFHVTLFSHSWSLLDEQNIIILIGKFVNDKENKLIPSLQFHFLRKQKISVF